MPEINAVYDHKKYEQKWWDFWEKGGWFHAEPDSNKKPYTIIIPPPNVTDRLHMGHGLNNTIQDILIRWKRMHGYNCCWLPGTDHAGIATQMMVEKSLEKQGTSRKQVGRENFFQKCVEWRNENGGIIVEQLKRIGASCDWSREAYTMSDSLSRAVRKIFVDLYDAGLIYRGERLVNWCPALKTAISDDELESKEVDGSLWYYRYPIKGMEGQYVQIATTRPETMLGDTAVAVNPNDDRYQHLIGQTAIVPFANREIPIIADEYVKSEYGTGCVKITPAHDPNDFEIGKRHALPFINIMNVDATLNENTPAPFCGMDRFEARKAIIRALKDMDLFEKQESTRHAVPYSERGKVPIEPMLSKQWFVNMKALAKPAIDAAKDEKLCFYPDSYKKVYFHWLENIQDWCISRQLWWGHRIPIWHCSECSETSTGLEDPEACQHCGSVKISQDEDVLDTWFSSWLWPLSPFGWPDETEDLKYFYPSNVLVTGADIIFLWVARMVMVGLWTKKEIPFKDVYFNSIICDKDGRKFSKTLGNGIDPLKIIDQRGADAMRYTCVNQAPIGGRVKMSETDFENGSRFVNKLWNAGRFLYSKIDAKKGLLAFTASDLNLTQKWLLTELEECAVEVDTLLERYAINEAVEVVFQLAWRHFCDWGLECSKDAIDGDDEHQRQIAVSVLCYVFDGILRLCAPIMPFVTEELWQAMPKHPLLDKPESLVIAKFPSLLQVPKFKQEAQEWRSVMEFITGIRSVRNQAGVPLKDRVEVYVECGDGFASLLQTSDRWVKKLAGVSTLSAGSQVPRPQRCLVFVGKGYQAFVPVGQYLDFAKERVRLENEIKRVEKIVIGLTSKISNKNFVERAPTEVVKQTKEQLANMQAQLENLQRSLEALG
ncbi:MAG: valine--tRNA ligase [Bdellovibrionota bacterium]